MTSLDRVKGALLAFISAATAPIKYCAPQLAIVQSVNGDGTLELQFPNANYPSISHCKLMQAYPAGTTTAAPGSVVLVAWANADPGQPYALGFDPAQGGTVKAVVPPTVGTASLVLASGDTVKITITDLELTAATIVASTLGVMGVPPPAITVGVGTAIGTITEVTPADGRTLYA